MAPIKKGEMKFEIYFYICPTKRKNYGLPYRLSLFWYYRPHSP